MNGPYFRDYHPLLDQQPDVGGIARSAEHAEQRAASTRKNLPLETMTALVMPASGEACTTKVQCASFGSAIRIGSDHVTRRLNALSAGMKTPVERRNLG